MDWFNDRLHDLYNAGSGTWLAIAAWALVALGIAALFFGYRQNRRNRELRAAEDRPHVAMYIEPNPKDWHIIDLVVKNFGTTAAHDIRFAFFNPLTVPRYEDGYHEGRIELAELELPSELPLLAPQQEWRTVWDSAMDREQLGDHIESRFVGSLAYFDDPPVKSRWSKLTGQHRREYKSKVILDWGSLQPAPRLALMTGHDLAKREKQKLDLLRNVLIYLEYATKETRGDVLRAEIERMNRAANETQSRYQELQEQTAKLDLPWFGDEAKNAPGRNAPGRHHHR